MRIAALDTTTPTASVAVWQDEKLLGQYTIQTTTHSTTVLPMLESLLSGLSLTVQDMDALAVSVGPGSFTGVRIGVATIKGLAFSHQIPCIGVSALEALAWNWIGFEGIVCPVINARRSHVYTALFSSSKKDGLQRLTEDDQLPVDVLADTLRSMGQPVRSAGDGLGMLQDALGAQLLPSIPELLRYPNAFHVACAAYKKYQDTADKSLFTEAALSPLYLRKSQAEREREERLAREQHISI